MLRSGKLVELVVDSFFPRRCVGCGRLGGFLCPECLGKLPRLSPPLCPNCGRPQASGIVCPDCWQRQTEIDGIRSLFRFDEIIRKAIHQLKYRNLKAISPGLAELLADYLRSNPLPGEVLICVPLHSRRLRERGYNQSNLLARELGERIDLPVIDNCLIRVKQAQPQVRAVDVEERRRNVADAFVCRDERVSGRQIILVDDVCTSGATLESCAVALKNKGATSVWGLTLAREIYN
ncbi:MAG TPA: ComF family protein [Dehalococcoidia bacterium]|nr:ComF family protein [Dehalococcoidia bacterium]